MPRKPRHPKRRPEADPFAVLGMWWLDLLGGFCDPSDPFTKAMWERHRNDRCFDPDMYGERPWGWWQFEAPKFDAPKRDKKLSHYAQLARWKLLTDEHVRNLRKWFEERKKMYEYKKDLSDIAMEAGEGLAELGLLTKDEHELVRAARLEEDRFRAEEEQQEAEWAKEAAESEAERLRMQAIADTPKREPEDT